MCFYDSRTDAVVFLKLAARSNDCFDCSSLLFAQSYQKLQSDVARNHLAPFALFVPFFGRLFHSFGLSMLIMFFHNCLYLLLLRRSSGFVFGILPGTFLSSSRAVVLSLRWFLYVTFEAFLLLKGFILTTPSYFALVLVMLINFFN